MTATFLELGHHGRMSNGMFQIAATIGYAKKYNVPFCFPKWEHQSLFNIPNEYFIDSNLICVYSNYNEPKYTYSEIPFQNSCSLSGYFQSWKYFEHCKCYIDELLCPTITEDLSEYCCVHVRRGDYLRFPEHHPIQNIDYYMRAAGNIPTKKFMVFSDDIEWCKHNFTGNEFTFNDTSSAADDFRRMVSCSSFIIANSSFSWWAAWLGKSQHKIVIAPKNWFGPALKKTHPIHDLIPEQWKII